MIHHNEHIPPSKTRNISIIAHIDHGKSTLADRFMEHGLLHDKRIACDRQLDSHELEKERGITIKAHPVSIKYIPDNDLNNIYELTFLDTPGHVDFSYEVSRALASTDGSIIVIDATKGIQAQTLSTVFMAQELNLPITLAINKIDLPVADINNTLLQAKDLLNIPDEQICLCSAKTGEGTKNILNMLINKIPAPKYSSNKPLRALIFDSVYDSYKGIIIYVRIFDGEIRRKTLIRFASNDKIFEVSEVGIFTPLPQHVSALSEGKIGFLQANIKTIEDVLIGDTITLANEHTIIPLQGFRKSSPVVFAGIYPDSEVSFDLLKSALYKLKLNDSSLTIHKETNFILGFGFRCGFLGLLHMDIVKERLKREFNLNVIVCSPTVSYKCTTKVGKTIELSNPELFPERKEISHTQEPWVKMDIILHNEFSGNILSIINEKRGICINTEVIDTHRILFVCEFPLNEIITDFNDILKSASKGYASFSYVFLEYRTADITKLSILVNNEPIEALSMLIHKKNTLYIGNKICNKLKEIIPRALVRINIQACVEGKIIASAKISALSKNVTEKCYGGDITRRQKLWKKQKLGKHRLLETYKVAIPNDALITILKNQS